MTSHAGWDSLAQQHMLDTSPDMWQAKETAPAAQPWAASARISAKWTNGFMTVL